MDRMPRTSGTYCREIEGYYVVGVRSRVATDPTKELALVPGAVKDAEEFLAANDETNHRLERVASLVQGFETPFGLELLATVHWVGIHAAAPDDASIVAGTYAWSERKRRFTREQIELAAGALRSGGWLPA